MITKKTFFLVSFFYVVVSLLFVVFSYGFVDGNLILSTSPIYTYLHTTLASLAFGQREVAASLFFVFITIYFALYLWLLRKSDRLAIHSVYRLLIGVSLVLSFAYTAVSYDLFNYITTAKVAFTHHENPYIIMPIDIANEPNLAFTRAANKIALYGPTWLILTVIPHVLGMGSVWATMITFKLFVVVWLWVLSYMLWRITRSTRSVVFFAFNPLVLIEIAVSGHNDIVMMTLAVAALFLSRSQKISSRLGSWILFFLAAGVKGATLVLALCMSRRFSLSKVYYWSFWIMLGVFVLVAPLREELYPWYALWFLPFAAILASQKKTFETGLAIAFTFGLELRPIPYMVMGYYEGPGPMYRIMLTCVPVAVYIVYWFFSRIKKRTS